MTARTALLMALLLLFQSPACDDDGQRLMQELNDPAPVKRAGAVRILWKRGDERAYRLANRALGDGSAIVRIAAVRALGDFTERDTSAALIRASHDSDPEVRLAAIAALATKRSELVERSLLDMLESRENNLQVREKLLQVLQDWELSGERLADRLAERRRQRIQDTWQEGSSERRARLVRLAARLFGGRGRELVLQALRDPDPLVVEAALQELVRSRQAVPRPELLRLTASDVPAVRTLAWQALLAGDSGAAVEQAALAALRDQDPVVRLSVLERLVELKVQPPAEVACRLLRPGSGRQARSVARLLARAGVRCPRQLLDELLAGGSDKLEVLETLVELGGGAAAALSTSHLSDLPGPLVAAAAVLAGLDDQRRQLQVRRELRRMLRQLQTLVASWPGSALAPLPEPSSGKPSAKLSEQQLESLYGKYDLELRPDSPRSVSDLLARFGDRQSGGQRLFDPLDQRWRRRLLLLLRAAMKTPGADVVAALEQLLAAGDEPLLVMALEALFENDPASKKWLVELAPRLESLLPKAGPRLAGQLVRLLQGSGRPQAAERICAALSEANWEKREAMLAALQPPAHPQLVSTLLKLLGGKSAASAAMALARLGAREAIVPLRQQLGQAGPAEELIFLRALAILGDESVGDRAGQLLLHPDYQARLLAVRVLASLPGGKARKLLLQRATYDIDTEVRGLARQLLAEGSGEHERENQKTQGSGRGVDAQGQVPQGVEEPAAGERAGP